VGNPPRRKGDDASTVKFTRRQAPLVPAARFSIEVLEGPDRGKRMTLDGTQPSAVLVGKSQACDLCLGDAMVSRRHLSLDLKERRLHLLDLGSSNGTRVNGLRVVDAYLEGGETVLIGETAFRVDLVSSSLVASLSPATSFGRLLGTSVAMRRLYPLCERLAASNVPVVIEGETGTGKELLAEALHEQGPRANGPFVVFDCTAVPPTLVESELFGHERGAFTGAVGSRRGVFEQADGGTLLIDEIGDLDPALQPKLLRALERSEVRRVGGDRTMHVDVRVICATRRDLDHEVQAGRFRDDLFHRLVVARVELPPLRFRRGDIRLLAHTFRRALGGDERAIPEHTLMQWEDYAWPGNVRELRNAVARHLAVGDIVLSDAEGPDVSFEETESEPNLRGAGPGFLEGLLAQGLPFATARQRMIEEFESQYVERLLAHHGGNVMRAAAASGLLRRQLQRVKARARTLDARRPKPR
jgi:two-component system response regulator HydG